MKLHDIVELKEALKTVYPTEGVVRELDQLVENIELIKDKYGDDYSYRFDQILKSISDIKQSLGGPAGIIDDMEVMVYNDLHDATEKFRLANYQDELRYGNPDRIREIRKLYVPNGVDEIVRQTIDLYVDWRYPGMEIGCRDGEFTKHLVAFDPLYVVDVFPEFIESTKSNFPPEYQNRLRSYLIENMNLNRLPKNQMAFVFSWNFFNYITLQGIEVYLKQVLEILRPGGVFMFTYNNADLPAPAAYADSYYMSYVPKSQLLPICESLGYEIVGTTDIEPAVSWVEIRKPGTLHSIKAHQVMGEIKHVNP